MQSLATLITAHGVDVHDHLDRDELVPVHDGVQFQGDVAVLPVNADVPATGTGYPKPVPTAGIPVVRGENGGNTHLLLTAGPLDDDTTPAADAEPVTWDPSTGGPTNLDLGVLNVPAGTTAWLAHPEHGYLGIGAGNYTIRRQREQADVILLVAD